MIVRKASAAWRGKMPAGDGTVHLPAAGLDAPYSFQSRFEDGTDTNPEELLGAAHAACFSMAFAGNLTRAGYAPEQVATEAQVHLQKSESGFEIPRIHLVTRVKAEGVSQDEFEQIAEKTKQTCPLSKVLAATNITLDASLEG